MTDDTIRMRATLEDDASGSLARIRKNMKAMNSEADTSRVRREFQQLSGPIRQVVDRMTGGVLPSFANFKFSAAGVGLVVAGAAVAFTKLSQNLKQFSDRNADLKFSAQGIGLTVQQLRAFHRTAQDVRINPEQATAGLQSFVKNAEDFRLRIGALREELHSYGAGDVVEAIARTKDNMEALRLAFERMQQLKARDPAIAKRFAESMFGMSEATRMTWEQFQKANAEMAKSATFTKEQLDASERFRKQFNALAETIGSASDKVKFGLLPGMADNLEGINSRLKVTIELFEKMGTFLGWGRPSEWGGKVEKLPGYDGGSFWEKLGNPGATRLGKRTSFDSEELRKFGDLLRKANFQMEQGARLSPFGPGNSGGVIAASFRSGGTVGGRAWGGGGYSVIPDGGGGAGERSGLPSSAELEAKDRAWWGGDSQGDVTGGGGGSDFLKRMRASLAQQSDDPSTRRLLRGVLSSENPGAGPAVIESLANRTQLVNEARAKKGLPPLTLRDMILGHRSIGGGKSFYGPVRTGAINSHMARADRDPAYAAKLDKNIDLALKGGSNWIKGHTDQGSAGDPNYHSGGVGVNINRERFNDWGYPGARAFRERLMAEYNKSPGMGGSASASIDRSMIDSAVSPPQVNATGSVNLTVNAPAGTKVAANSTGMFQETRVRRQKQMVGPDEFE